MPNRKVDPLTKGVNASTFSPSVSFILNIIIIYLVIN